MEDDIVLNWATSNWERCYQKLLRVNGYGTAQANQVTNNYKYYLERQSKLLQMLTELGYETFLLVNFSKCTAQMLRIKQPDLGFFSTNLLKDKKLEISVKIKQF
jgi:N-acetyl-anhydromuramyl-L-alanine amidase AmpD